MKFAKILILDDYKKETRKYEFRIGDPDEKSLLHYAAEYNFKDIAEVLVHHYPELLYRQTELQDKINRFPVELALINFHDDVASFLMRKMPNER